MTERDTGTTGRLQSLYNAVLTGDADAGFAVTSDALERGIDAQDLVTSSMIPAMDEVGRRFEQGDYFVPELLIAARAMNRAMELIRPILAERGAEPLGKVVIGSVQGDIHDIGKNLVASMLEGGGFEVVDLGANVAPETFVQAVRENGAEIVGLSALLTTTMPSMKTTIDALQEAGLKQEIKVIIGGAPVTPGFADEVGADGYGKTAVDAVALARKLIRAAS